MAEKKKRGQNFSPQDKEKLIHLLELFKETILNKKTDGTTNDAKSKAWDSLTLRFNSSSSYPRTKDSLIKLWDKLKTEAKLYSSKNNLCKTGTGGGPDGSKVDAVLDLVVGIMGRGCTGIEGVCDSDMNVIQLDDSQLTAEHIEPIIIEAYDDSEVVVQGFTNTDDPEHETSKEPLWARRRRPQLSLENERTKSVQNELISSFKNVNEKKNMAEDLKFKLLQEELTFKRELQKRQLEEFRREICIKIEAASYERDMKKEVLSQLKGKNLDELLYETGATRRGK